MPDTDQDFWLLADSVPAFQQQIQRQLRRFYAALAQLSGQSINLRKPLALVTSRRDHWLEVLDINASIVVCSGEPEFSKPYALAKLHDVDLKISNIRGVTDYDKNLCGGIKGDVKPSPIWITNLEDYQVVTIFGSNQSPRADYLHTLRVRSNDYKVIWPFS